ncbi:Ubiquitin ligase-binding protein BUL1 [Candida viswanathii]|uniref:Ubiquitin ligase-binding protein BUL1 n=1 Tax=Candida viswanathii TaxID=5486 RepID=A0A367Y5H5_9ASCO|nr:Ubiquitin ligase-binding protein BUL1 [Candida viswanathii]
MEDRNKFRLKLSSLTLRDSSLRSTATSSTRNSSDSSSLDSPVQSQDDGANELINILPSYQMYRSTITKNLTPSLEDLRTQPPSYEATPDLSSAGMHEYFASVPTSPALGPTTGMFDGAVPSINDDSEAAGASGMVSDETILENAHKLKRLTSTNKEISKQLEVKIHLTKQIGKVGEPYTKIDPLTLELKQGDYVYGFVLITNKTKNVIPFDMFSVQLEGCATFGKTSNITLVEQPTHIDRFLTMFDFNALWNDAFLDRLVTDHNDPNRPQPVFDAFDNTYYHLDHRKIFEPGVTYKKYFTFKIPEKLLESACEDLLIKHLQIPPTLGVCKNEMISSVRHRWIELGEKDTDGTGQKKYKYASLTNDFALNDTSISYCISARIIGRASGYEKFFGTIGGAHSIDQTNDEYVVANEDYKYLRLIPMSKPIFELNRSMIHQEARLLYTSMVDKIKDKITLGNDIIAANQQQNSLQPTSSGGSLRPTASASSMLTPAGFTDLRPVSSEGSTSAARPPLTPTQSTSDFAKMQQSYYSKVNQRNVHVLNDDTYEVFFPVKKKSVFGGSKMLGLVAFSTPKKEYFAHYMPLPQFQPKTEKIHPSTLQIPIDLTFMHGDEHKHVSSSSLPDFKSLSVELIALTIKSKNIPIPVVIHPEMMFDNKTKNNGCNNDNFDILTIKRFQKYAVELLRILKEIGSEPIDIDRELVQDIKCLASLTTRYVHMKVKHVGITSGGVTYDSVSSVPWHKEVLDSHLTTAKWTKNMMLSVNLGNAVMKPTNSADFCLVPDFQTCLLARMYYLKIDLKFHTLEKVSLRVPVVLQKTQI